MARKKNDKQQGEQSEFGSGFSDLLNIQGDDIPDIDKKLDALLSKGKVSATRILEGASTQVFGDQTPYARTEVSIDFEDERDLRRCVRLLRWSDERLRALGSSIAWSWDKTVREGMNIKFAVNWYDKDFFEQRRNAFRDKAHLSYFKMFGKAASDMHVHTEVLGTR